MTRLIIGAILGALLLFSVLQYHLVRGNDGLFLIPKTTNSLTDIYVDTRKFDLSDWRKNRPLAVAIVRSKHTHLLADSSLHSFRDSTQRWVRGFFGEL